MIWLLPGEKLSAKLTDVGVLFPTPAPFGGTLSPGRGLVMKFKF